MLRAGGSAVDAAIAAAAVLSVVYPHMTSIGGDSFWLVHSAREGGVRFLDGGGRAPVAATIAAFQGRGLSEVPYRGVLPATVTVPGAVASWVEAHAAYGRLPRPQLFAPAIACAREGFSVGARLAYWIEHAQALLAETTETAAIFLPDGRPLRAGESLRNPDLARTLGGRRGRGTRGLLRGRGRARDRPVVARERRPRGGGGLPGAARGLGRAALRDVSRGHALRDAAAHPGDVGAADAAPDRALRSRLDGLSRSGPRASPRPGQADRLSRPRSRACRPRFREGARGRGCSRRNTQRGGAGSSTCAAPCRGTRCRASARLPGTPCTSPRWTGRGMPRRSSTACTARSARAWWRGAPASSCRIAAPISAWIRRTRIGSSPASDRCTR